MKVSSIHPILISDNVEKLREFYASIGFATKHTSITDFGTPVHIVATDTADIELMESPKNPHFPMPTGLYGLRINVDDLEAAVEAIRQNGGEILTGLLETPYAKVYAAKDADGNYLTIMQHNKK